MSMTSQQLQNAAREELLRRFVEFLKESNAFDKILNIDYSLPALQMKEHGQFGALLELQERALKHVPISISDLCRWQSMIVMEQLQFGHSITKQAVGKIRSSEVPINITVDDYVSPDFSSVPASIEKIVANLNRRLHELGNKGNEGDLAALLGDIYQQFEEVHPFVEANGRLGRLLANYIVSWFGFPVIVFRVSEKAEFYAAHQNAKFMRIFMAKKLQEAVFDEEGRILTLCENYGSSASYCNPANPEAEKLLVEWHSLLKAMDQWK